MYESFKRTGVLDDLKSTRRYKLLDHLQAKKEKSATLELKMRNEEAKLTYKLAASLIADFMEKVDLNYSMSVFLPESGFGGGVLAKGELAQLLGATGGKPDTSLLVELVESMRQGGGFKPNAVACSTQTDDMTQGMSLDQKLQRLDYIQGEVNAAERLAPFKTLEERMLKYRRECDARVRQEVQAEVARIREIEVANVRLEERTKYQQKLSSFRNDLETLH